MSLPAMETDCTCLNTSCQNHKNCVACFNFHTDKPKPPHCLRPESNAAREIVARVRERLTAAGIACDGCSCSN